MNSQTNVATEASHAQLIEQMEVLRHVRPTDQLTANVLLETGTADRYFRMATAAGDAFVAYNKVGISFIERVGDTADFEMRFHRHFGRRAYCSQDPPSALLRRIEAKLNGRPQRLTFDLRRVTDFQRQVLFKALEIPYGQVRPYGWIAREIGRPRAQRAVGSALASNPIPLLIPCHRVVRNDGIIGNYGMGGPVVKKRVLAAEGIDPDNLEEMARNGTHYFGSDTTHIFCFPTCNHARRVTNRHRTQFHSVSHAIACGYRPCKMCRPADPESL